jgi:hypothetical protein
MKLSELIAGLKEGERVVLNHLVFVYRHNDRGDELRLTDRVDNDIAVQSNPPGGSLRVKNMYIDPTAGEVAVEYENIPSK